MEPNSLKDLPHVDADGYYDGLMTCMADGAGQLMLGDGAYDIEPPKDDGKHFYRLSADKKAWEAEAIPTTAAECVGIVLDHQSQTDRVHRLREVFDALTKDSSEFRLVQDPETNARHVEAIPPKTEEELEAEALEQAKAERAEAVSKIVVEVDGMKFDGDETAQTRMGRTISAAIAEGADLETTKRVWVLADNSVAQPTVAQLAKALKLAGDAQTALWTVPYEAKE